MQPNIQRLLEIAKHGVITHKGHFHADDILSAALLKITNIIHDVRVIQRVGAVPDNFNGLVFDIGYGEFDHHQENATYRTNGYKYASFGLLWQSIGTEYIVQKYNTTVQKAQKAANKFDSDFVTSMDLTDNFGQSKFPNSLAYLVASRNNGDFTTTERDEMFYEIADSLCVYLESMIKTSYDFVNYRTQASEIAKKNPDGIVIFGATEFIPRDAFVGTNIKCIIKLTDRGTYNITTIEPYKIDNSFIKMPGCVQVWETGAAFKTLEKARYAATQFVNNINLSK